MKPDTNFLGEYLKALREERGFNNIREYVRHYNLPVGYVYYTEIESGKKYLALETGRQLCEALNADILSFYSQLLKDILPEEVQDNFLNLIPLAKNVDPKELADKQLALKNAYQKFVLARINQKVGTMPKETQAQRVTEETIKTLREMNGHKIPDPHASNCFYGVAGLTKEKQHELARLIADLSAEFESYQTPGEEPQLLALSLAPINNNSRQS